jgi:spore coat polysaccharide biosynthesis protein SpsF
VIQARMGSTRLPGKVLLPLLGEPVLVHVVRRVSRASRVDTTVVATTTDAADDQIESLAAAQGWPLVRGSQEDLLDRYLLAARTFDAECVVRVTSDCPLVDPLLIDSVIVALAGSGADYASNTLPPRMYPRGLDVEAFTRAALERAGREDHDPARREHATPYLYDNPDLFRLIAVPGAADHSEHRWTLDTPEDYTLIGQIYRALGNDTFGWTEALALVLANPGWMAINRHIVQK